MADRATFYYTPLDNLEDEIRLITLFPGTSSSSIRCKLRTARLDERPQYEAISYMWGEPRLSALSILINEKKFSIRENLWDALVALQELNEERILWIDAICINQDDLKEVSAQVRQMRRIFEQAQCVRAWVGNKSSDSDLAISTLRELGASSAVRENDILKARDSWSKWNAVFNFLLRSYWSRVWIIQELAMARSIVICCGRDIVPWKCISAALRIIEDLVNSKWKMRLPKHAPLRGDWATMLSGICDTHPLLLDRQRAQRRGSRAFDINVLLGISQKSGCSNPRDKIYGLLGLMECTEMPVDYSKDMFQLYGDTIQYMNDEALRGNPSIRDFLTIRFSQCGQALLHGPHPNSNHVSQFVTVKGICSSRISTIGPSYTRSRNGTFPIENAVRIATGLYGSDSRACFLSTRKLQKSGKVLRTRLQSFWPVSVVRSIESNTFSATRVTNPPELTRTIKSLKMYISAFSATTAVSERPLHIKSQRSQPLPRFFLGENGQVGLVPGQTQKGDLICQFVGSDVAVVLHQKDTGNSYGIVGRALMLRELNEERGKGGGFGSSAKFLIGSVPQAEQISAMKEYLSIVMELDTLQELTYDSYYWY